MRLGEKKKRKEKKREAERDSIAVLAFRIVETDAGAETSRASIQLLPQKSSGGLEEVPRAQRPPKKARASSRCKSH